MDIPSTTLLLLFPLFKELLLMNTIKIVAHTTKVKATLNTFIV